MKWHIRKLRRPVMVDGRTLRWVARHDYGGLYLTETWEQALEAVETYADPYP